jgi:hypothetical protein
MFSASLFTYAAFAFMVILNFALAALLNRNVAQIGEATIRLASYASVGLLILISTLGIREFLVRFKPLGFLVWEIVFFGIFPYSLFVLMLALNDAGSVRTIGYVQANAVLTAIVFAAGFLLGLYFFTHLLSDEASD